jgi:AmmeMemoRadiSam system protein A
MRPTEHRLTGSVLLSLARAAMEEEFTREFGHSRTVDATASWLQEPGACFVTLTQDEQLRGCIGTLEAHRPLLLDVRANAVAAAFRDPRFAPLAARELARTEVEVSLLSPMQALEFGGEADALAQLRPGIDGVVFEFGARRSTFLPQVWEQLPDVDDFMAQLKRKAGLPADFWHAQVRLQCYTVSQWKERELRLAPTA